MSDRLSGRRKRQAIRVRTILDEALRQGVVRPTRLARLIDQSVSEALALK